MYNIKHIKFPSREREGLLPSHNSTKRSLHFNCEFPFRVKTFRNKGTTYFFSLPGYPDYPIPGIPLTPLKYKFKSKSSGVMKRVRGNKGESEAGRAREYTSSGYHYKEQLLC